MPSIDVAIVDAGGANHASLQFALERLGASSAISADADTISAAPRVILPGVGAAADAMERLRARRLDELIPSLRQPVLGICLGMQLLAAASEEHSADCLGVVSGTSRELTATRRTPVPNMGWCRLSICAQHPLLFNVPNGSYFYFVHSYALPATPYTVATAEHSETFSAVLAHGNFVATQFHPERSAAAGARVLQNFLRMPACT